MVGAQGPARAAFGADGQRHTGFTAKHITKLGRLIAELIHNQAHKIHIHNLHHRPHSGYSGAYARADYGCLRDSRIPDTLVAVLLPQPLGDAVGPAVDGHVLAHDEH